MPESLYFLYVGTNILLMRIVHQIRRNYNLRFVMAFSAAPCSDRPALRCLRMVPRDDQRNTRVMQRILAA